MKVNTGAVVKGKIDVNDLVVDQNTGSIVTLSGDAGKLEVDGDTGACSRELILIPIIVLLRPARERVFILL
jgi:hypothetical protein